MKSSAQPTPETLYNETAEQAVLSCVLLESERIAEIDYLQPEHFGLERHARIFRSMRQLPDRRKSIDVITLSAQLDSEGDLSRVGGNSYLTQLLASIPTASRIRDYAKIVFKICVKRETVLAATKISEVGYDSKNLSPSQIFERVRGLANGIPQFDTTDDATSYPATWADLETAIATSHGFGTVGYRAAF